MTSLRSLAYRSPLSMSVAVILSVVLLGGFSIVLRWWASIEFRSEAALAADAAIQWIDTSPEPARPNEPKAPTPQDNAGEIDDQTATPPPAPAEKTLPVAPHPAHETPTTPDVADQSKPVDQRQEAPKPATDISPEPNTSTDEPSDASPQADATPFDDTQPSVSMGQLPGDEQAVPIDASNELIGAPVSASAATAPFQCTEQVDPDWSDLPAPFAGVLRLHIRAIFKGGQVRSVELLEGPPEYFPAVEKAIRQYKCFSPPDYIVEVTQWFEYR